MLTVIFFVYFALLLLSLYSCIKPYNFPPGPKWYPIIGCFPIFYKLKQKFGYTHLALLELSKIYGPVVGLKLGKQRLVVISSHDLVKEALTKEEFNGRPDGFFFRVRSFGKKIGVLFTEGKIWQQHRRFTMRHLKAFGFGQETMACQLTFEAQSLVDYLKLQSKNGPVPFHNAFDTAVLNSLWTMFAGHRFEHNDEKLKEILEVVHEVFRINDTVGGIISHMPFVRYIAPELSGFNELMTTLRRLWLFLSEEIAEHEASLSENQQPRDLIDAFLMEISRVKATAKNDENNIFDHENLLILCLDLFLAGSKTTTDTLASIFAFLALNPKYIKELQQELDQVIGRSRAPTLKDMSDLPKIEAFLAEAQRTLLLAPLGVPHKTIKDVTLNGYLIPKDTIVLMNYYSVQNDKKYWDKPEEFRPQRFLDNEGKFRSVSAAIPFGVGKRRCLGEGLARHSLFLFFVYVIHNFNIETADEYNKPDLDGIDGFVISPKPYYLRLTAREDDL